MTPPSQRAGGPRIRSMVERAARIADETPDPQADRQSSQQRASLHSLYDPRHDLGDCCCLDHQHQSSAGAFSSTAVRASSYAHRR